jgi:hypothetical protein
MINYYKYFKNISLEIRSFAVFFRSAHTDLWNLVDGVLARQSLSGRSTDTT